jgi:predicted transcriptional regulator
MTQEEASAQQTRKLLDRIFSGRASLLINHLVDSGEITLKEMDELIDMMKKKAEK